MRSHNDAGYEVGAIAIDKRTGVVVAVASVDAERTTGLQGVDAADLPFAERPVHEAVTTSQRRRCVDGVGDGHKRIIEVGDTAVKTEIVGIADAVASKRCIATVAAMSMFLDQVKLDCAWKLCEKRFSNCACNE